mmetsp:Transcript_22201/g.39919  ORF Transcript_22201/g.39919 Transcript_22201/m.39919 type:complete len:84 (-) Transcript_22201:112-363(-)
MIVPSLVDPVLMATMVNSVVVMLVIEIIARQCKQRQQHLGQQNQQQHHSISNKGFRLSVTIYLSELNAENVERIDSKLKKEEI